MKIKKGADLTRQFIDAVPVARASIRDLKDIITGTLSNLPASEDVDSFHEYFYMQPRKESERPSSLIGGTFKYVIPTRLLHLMVFKAIDDTQHDSLEKLLQSWPAPTPLEEQNGPQALGRSL